jgi:hypothetical protein
MPNLIADLREYMPIKKPLNRSLSPADRSSMTTRRRFLSGFIICGFFAVLLGQACSDLGSQSANSSALNGPLEPLTLSPTNANITPGGSIQLVATGGYPPYSFALNYGVGTVTASGLYTAPAGAAAGTSTATITCTDSVGDTAYAMVTMVSTALTLSAVPTYPTINSAVTINVMGGTAPYYFQKISGSGSLFNNIYQTPGGAETAIINVIDSSGLSANIVLTVH